MALDTSVLIAGAGPTGLTLAIELARRQIDFRIVDASSGLFQGSRGKGVQPRTLEVFEDLGVLDAVLAAGGPYPRFRVHIGPLSFPFGGLSKRVAPTPSAPYPNLWMLPQWRTDEILHARLEELGGQVELSSPLTTLEQDPGGVTVTLSTPAGTRRLRAGYLIGCDGGHSAVRKALGVRFEGEALEAPPVLLADVEIDGLDRSHWHIWPVAAGGRLALCPLPGTSRFQLTALLAARADAPDTSEDGIRDFIARRIDMRHARIGRVSWTSLFRPQVRMVDRYRVGRVLLAGDAAHVHPPSGGQGLNTGIQDACNLGWKLAGVVGGASAALLDTYESERLPIAASVLGLSKRLMLEASARRGPETQQLGLHYRGSSLAVDDMETPGRLRAGDRAPDAPCVDGSGAPRRLFEIFRGTHMTLLDFGGHGDVPACVRARQNGAVKIVRVFRTGETAPAEALIDIAGHARRAYGIGEGAALILIRPDGYIGYFGRPGSWGRLDRYLSSVFDADRGSGTNSGSTDMCADWRALQDSNLRPPGS
jgi:2-polyprenyl-6-methoxyphenol hydroxylase-like FAD-dependent oxidoreductase